VIVPPLKI